MFLQDESDFAILEALTFGHPLIIMSFQCFHKNID